MPAQVEQKKKKNSRKEVNLASARLCPTRFKSGATDPNRARLDVGGGPYGIDAVKCCRQLFN